MTCILTMFCFGFLWWHGVNGIDCILVVLAVWFPDFRSPVFLSLLRWSLATPASQAFRTFTPRGFRVYTLIFTIGMCYLYMFMQLFVIIVFIQCSKLHIWRLLNSYIVAQKYTLLLEHLFNNKSQKVYIYNVSFAYPIYLHTSQAHHLSFYEFELY